MRANGLYTSISLAALLAMAPAAVYAQAQTFSFDLPAQGLGDALRAVGRMTHEEVIFDGALVHDVKAPALKGSYTAEAAIAKLVEGTGLTAARSSNGVWRVTKAVAATSGMPSFAASEVPVEVVVTGTHLRDVNPTSPVHVVGRKDIDQSGYSQVGDLVRSLPEDFGGGQNPGIIGASVGNSDNGNVSSGSTVNLRGIGTDATLVLINGHRLVGDSFHQGPDISGIPMAAINRVEVVPDGASALYGSDAVAGVVNFVMRKDYRGGEISARIGGTAEGGGTERTVSFLDGVATDTAYLLANVETSKEDKIDASDRAFTVGAPPAETLLPAMERTSFYMAAGWKPNDRLSFSADTLISDRKATILYQSSPTAYVYLDTVRTPAYTASISADAKIAADWVAHLTGTAANSRNSDFSYSPGYSSTLHYRNNETSVELSTDGTLFHLGDNVVKAAFGIGQRTEGYVNGDIGGFDYQVDRRRVNYLFAEASIPVVTPSPDRQGLNELELSVSGRSEHYTEFGTATTPRIGVRYVPFSGLTVRGSWGKSFKAPSFTELYTADILYVYDSPTVGGQAGQTALMNQGGNPDLKPERSTSWTLGAEYVPRTLPSVTLSMTYFNIDYTDRVVQPISNLSAALSDPTYAAFVERNPTNAEKAQLVANAYYVLNFSSSAYNPATVTSVLSDSYANAEAQTIHGVDASYRQSFRLSAWQMAAFANATWLNLEQKTLPTLPAIELSGSVFYPPKFKARGGLSARRGDWSLNGILNVISSELDPATSPSAKIASWSTVDGNVSYAFSKQSGLTRGVRLTLAATNLFDRAPPHTISPLGYAGLNFDSTNASIVGRFVSVTLVKAW